MVKGKLDKALPRLRFERLFLSFHTWFEQWVGVSVDCYTS